MDYSTSHIFYLVSLGLFTVVLLSLSLVDRSVVGSRWLALSTSLEFAKTLLQERTGHLPRWVTVFLANELNVLAFVAMFFGLRWFVDRKPFHRWEWLIPVAAAMAAYPALYFASLRQWSFAAISLPVAALCVAAVWKLTQQRDERFKVPALLTAALLTTHVAVLGYRIGVSMELYPRPAASPWGDSRWMYSMVALMLVGYCLMILYALFTVIEVHSSVEHAAGVDALTGALNRRALVKHGARELARSDRLGRPLAVICMDLDNFKRVNDTHGHPGGDVALCAFVDLAKEHLRSCDVVARTGGEEFVMLLPEMDLGGANYVAERLRHALEQMRIHYDGRMIQMTASAGVTQVVPGDTLAAVLKRADGSLYRAKSEGRNRVVVDEMVVSLPRPVLVERLVASRSGGKTA